MSLGMLVAHEFYRDKFILTIKAGWCTDPVTVLPMSMFTSANACRLMADGRTHAFHGKPSETVSIGDDCILRCSNAAGFRISVRLDNNADTIISSDVECILADGTVLTCEGRIDHASGTLRLDAVDQGNFSWFWFEVRPGFIRHSRR